MTPAGSLRALAPAKVNACLFVGTPRADGLHPLVSVIQPLSLADELELTEAPGGAQGDQVVCPQVPGPNLAARALAAYRAATGWDVPAQRLEIGKRVPVAAGMGGGSSDAAAALRLAATAAGRPADPACAQLAPALGSDVPAALLAQRCLVTGAGERVEPLPDPALFALVILPSSELLSTAAVYAELDRRRGGRPAEELAEVERLVRSSAARAEALPPELAVNDLQAAAHRLCPSIAAALDALLEAGADRSMVSGSGPTAVGWFDGPGARVRAREALEALRNRRPGPLLAEPVGSGFAEPRAA